MLREYMAGYKKADARATEMKTFGIIKYLTKHFIKNVYFPRMLTKPSNNKL